MSYCEHLYETRSNGTNSVTVLHKGTEAISNSCHEEWRGGISLRHQLMALLSKEPLAVLLLRSPNCFHLNNPHRVPASIGVYMYL